MSRSVAEAIGAFNAAHPIGQVLGVRLRRQAGTNGGELHGPCPACGGVDRLRAYPRPKDGRVRAVCRRCGRSGDPLRWAMWLAGCDPDAPGATVRYLREHGLLDAPAEPSMPRIRVAAAVVPPAVVARLERLLPAADTSDTSPTLCFPDSRARNASPDASDASDAWRRA